MIALLLLRLLPHASAAPCEAPVTRDALAAEVAEADLAFSRVDWVSLGARGDALAAMVPCVETRLLAADLAPIFRIRGWALFAAGDSSAWGWLATGSGLQPRHVYDPPLRGPMATAWAAAAEQWSAAVASPVPLDPPDAGQLLVNGVPSGEAPRKVPWVLQHVGADGAVRATWLLGASDAVPPYPRAPVAADPIAPTPVPGSDGPPSTGRHRSRGLALAGGTSVGLGVGGLVAAHATKQSYKRTGDPGLKGPNAAAGGAGFALLGVGAALGSVAVVRGEW